MRRLALNLAIAATFVLGFANAGESAPGVKINNDTFDFGKVIQNATATHAFWIKSTGTETLNITGVEPGCGCTQMPLTDSSVAVGDSTPLQIIFSTKSFIGNVNKRPFIVTNAPQASAGMSIFAEILTDPESALPVVLRPARLDVSQFSVQPRRRGTFEIVNKSSEPLKIAPVDTVYKSFTIELPSKIGAGETVKGTIIVNKAAIEKSFRESFTFEVVGSESRDRYTLPIERIYRIKDTSTVNVTGGK